MIRDSTTGNYDMATQNEERPYIIPSLDAGMQMRSTEFLAQKGEVVLASNADPVQKIGALTKVPPRFPTRKDWEPDRYEKLSEEDRALCPFFGLRPLEVE